MAMSSEAWETLTTGLRDLSVAEEPPNSYQGWDVFATDNIVFEGTKPKEFKHTGVFFAVRFENCTIDKLTLNNCRFVNVLFTRSHFFHTVLNNVHLTDVVIDETFFNRYTLAQWNLQGEKCFGKLFECKDDQGAPVPTKIAEEGWLADWQCIEAESPVHDDPAHAAHWQKKQERRDQDLIDMNDGTDNPRAILGRTNGGRSSATPARDGQELFGTADDLDGKHKAREARSKATSGQWEDEEDLRQRRLEAMTDEQIARLLAKQEELRIDGDDLVIDDGMYKDVDEVEQTSHRSVQEEAKRPQKDEAQAGPRKPTPKENADVDPLTKAALPEHEQSFVGRKEHHGFPATESAPSTALTTWNLPADDRGMRRKAQGKQRAIDQKLKNAGVLDYHSLPVNASAPTTFTWVQSQPIRVSSSPLRTATNRASESPSLKASTETSTQPSSINGKENIRPRAKAIPLHLRNATRPAANHDDLPRADTPAVSTSEYVPYSGVPINGTDKQDEAPKPKPKIWTFVQKQDDFY